MSLTWLFMLGRVHDLSVPACTAPGAHVPALILVPSLLSVAAAVLLLVRDLRRGGV